jgi:hypothetical protein
MTDRINGVRLGGIVEFLEGGIHESQRVAMKNNLVDDEGYESEPREFANRMTVRLNTAIKRIKQLEAQAVADSWKGEVDRQAGSFTADELTQRETW